MRDSAHYAFLDLMDFLWVDFGETKQIIYRHLNHCDACRGRLVALMRQSTRRQEEVNEIDLLSLLKGLPAVPAASWPVARTAAITLLSAVRLLIDHTFGS